MSRSASSALLLWIACLASCHESALPDRWLGKWIGPEGTYLNLSKDGGQHYRIEIQSLDSLDIYPGTPNGGGIQFIRRGRAESIHAGSGNDTGMKWLLGKQNCLVIQTGEGFCRD